MRIVRSCVCAFTIPKVITKRCHTTLAPPAARARWCRCKKQRNELFVEGMAVTPPPPRVVKAARTDSVPGGGRTESVRVAPAPSGIGAQSILYAPFAIHPRVASSGALAARVIDELSPSAGNGVSQRRG